MELCMFGTCIYTFRYFVCFWTTRTLLRVPTYTKEEWFDIFGYLIPKSGVARLD